MTILNHATAPERERGLVWMETFQDASSVIANGGTIVGSPTFSDGVVLNGTTEYISFNNVGRDAIFGSEWSIVIEFSPSFASDDGATHFIVDTTAGNEYGVRKAAAGANNAIGVQAGGSNLNGIGVVTYGPLWNINARNTLVVTSTTGNTKYYFNGTDVRAALDTTAWTSASPTTMVVGASNVGSSYFGGTIHSIKVFNVRLTNTEAMDYSAGTDMFNYENDVVLDLALNLTNHDPDNSRALDWSGNANHAAFGATTAEPTKNSHQVGYNFDGTDDHMVITSSASLNFGTGNFTISAWSKQPVIGAEDIVSKRNGVTNTPGFICGISGLGLAFTEIDDGAGNEVASEGVTTLTSGAWNHIVWTYDRLGNVSTYVNGRLDKETDISAVGDIDNAIDFYVGRNGDGSRDFTGDIALLKAWNQVLTPLQILDLFIKEQKKLNEA